MEQLKQEAKELGIKGYALMKKETLIKKIEEAKKEQVKQEQPEVMRKGVDVKVVTQLLKKNLMHNGRVYFAGEPCPDGVDKQSLSDRGII